jgi:hypothetical protein
MTSAVAGIEGLDPLTFIVTLGGYIPSAFDILYAALAFIGLLFAVTALVRQIQTAKGRGEFMTHHNVMTFVYGAVLAVLGSIIGALGKGIFGDFQNASALLYVARDEHNLSRVAAAAFMSLLQFIGALACAEAIILANRISTNKARPGDTWGAAFIFFFVGGIPLVFIQQTIGLISAFSGINFAKYINQL